MNLIHTQIVSFMRLRRTSQYVYCICNVVRLLIRYKIPFPFALFRSPITREKVSCLRFCYILCRLSADIYSQNFLCAFRQQTKKEEQVARSALCTHTQSKSIRSNVTHRHGIVSCNQIQSYQIYQCK